VNFATITFCVASQQVFIVVCVKCELQFSVISEMGDLKEQHIYMKFCFKLEKTISEMQEMLKTAFSDNAIGRTQTFEWYSQFKHGFNIKSMLVIFFDCEGIVHQEFVPPGQTVNQHYNMEVLKHLREQVHLKCLE
jgi:hypothetical protein